MSRRKQRAREAGGVDREAGGPGGAKPLGGRGAGSEWGLGLQIGFAIAAFALGVLVAELAGAANLGVSFGIGQIAFAIAVTYLLVRR